MSIKKSISATDFLSCLQQKKASEEWLAALQAQALQDLKQQGFPSRAVESWKYTDVEPVLKNSFTISSQAQKIAFQPIQGTCSIVFVDGVYCEELSKLTPLPDGLEVKPLSQAVVENADLVKRALSDDAPSDCANPFTRLNQAFVASGVLVVVAANKVIDQPLHLVNIGTRSQAISVLRNIISLGASSELEIFEDYISAADVVTLSNPVSNVFLGPNAVLRHVRNQSQNHHSFHFSAIKVSQERDSSYYSQVFTCGSAISRLDLSTELNAENARCDLKGLYTLKGSQLADNHTVINHHSARTFSNQLYKGILDDRSRGVYNGRVFIAADAQLVESSQLNKNLMLSDRARVDTKPELDVLANDVKAAHGATIGQLNDDELFYIQSRCIAKDEAMAILVQGHMEEIIAAVSSEPVRTYLEKIYIH